MNGTDGRRRAPTPVSLFGTGRRAGLLRALGALLALGCALGAASILEIDGRPGLEVDDGAGRRLALVALPEGRFVHTYIHSIHRTRVDEHFRIEDGSLRLYELRYDTTSTGMPSEAEGGFRLEGGRFVLQMDRSFERIPIMVSHVPGHGIRVGGDFFPFDAWAPAEEGLVLRARTGPIIRLRIPRGR